MKNRVAYITSLFFIITLLLFSTSDLYATTIDLRHLTFGFYREDWPVIYKDKILWLDEGVVKGYNFELNEYFNLFPGDQPLETIYGLAGYDGRYLVYIRADNENLFDVAAYDIEEEKDMKITDSLGSQWPTDYDNKTIPFKDLIKKIILVKEIE